MTREQRERAVAEALEWMTEEDLPAGSRQQAACSKFPGWNLDPQVDGALLECILVIHPEAKLIPVLAAMRMHWLPQGRTTTRAWRARLRNWCSARKSWDPLLSGERGDRPAAFGGDELPRPRPARRLPADRPVLPEPVTDGEVVKAELAKIRGLVGI